MADKFEILCLNFRDAKSNEEEKAIHEELKKFILEESDLLKYPNSNSIWEMIWDWTHSNGYYEARVFAKDLAEVIHKSH